VAYELETHERGSHSDAWNDCCESVLLFLNYYLVTFNKEAADFNSEMSMIQLQTRHLAQYELNYYRRLRGPIPPSELPKLDEKVMDVVALRLDVKKLGDSFVVHIATIFNDTDVHHFMCMYARIRDVLLQIQLFMPDNFLPVLSERVFNCPDCQRGKRKEKQEKKALEKAREKARKEYEAAEAIVDAAEGVVYVDE